MDCVTRPTPEQRKAAFELVAKYGWNTTCFQTLNPGIKWWFSLRHQAFVAYVEYSGVRVVAGAPISSEEDLPHVISDWEAAAETMVCYFGAEDRIQSLLGRRSGYSTSVLGAQPVWSPHEFVERFWEVPSQRAQLRRASNKGATVSEWSVSRATNDPGLQGCLDEWLSTRGLPPLHFLVEADTLGTLDGRRIFVVELTGQPVGFVVMAPIPQRRGWLTEQFVRGAQCPNGGIELCLHSAVQATASEGYDYVTMGIVPLSELGTVEGISNPRWLNFIESWMRAHARRFYNFDGLEAFKAKFRPSFWEPVFVVSKEESISFNTLYAVAGAFTARNPFCAVGIGMMRALKQEMTGLARNTRGVGPKKARPASPPNGP